MEHTLKDRIVAFDVATPRYTSYPPATAFRTDFPPQIYAEWLKDVGEKSSVSLYVHIPFCQQLCYYCGCFTTISTRDERIESYIDSVIREIGLVVQNLPTSVTVSHLHFGGGSPTILSSALFTRLMDEIRQKFSFAPGAEIAIEADPRQMTKDRIALLAQCGINRISLGVQDIDQHVMTAVNRPQPFELSRDAVSMCRAHGIEQINIDLMYGLPGQTVESIRNTVETVIVLKPNRIAFFGYAHVPWMKKHMRIIGDFVLPDTSLRYDLYETGRRALTDAGYLEVGIDHFVYLSDTMAHALGNRTLRRNFQGYTTDHADTLIGLGASSIGQFPQGYVQNSADLRVYQEKIGTDTLPVSKGYHITPDDRAHSAVIAELMCYMAVDVMDISARYNLAPDYFLPNLARLTALAASGLVSVDHTFVRVHHPLVARLAAACFDENTAQPLQNRHSRSV